MQKPECRSQNAEVRSLRSQKPEYRIQNLRPLFWMLTPDFWLPLRRTPMRVNQLKKTLKSGGLALGTLVWETRGRGVVHTLAAAGMDFVMICTEHSAYNLETVVELVAQAHAAGL